MVNSAGQADSPSCKAQESGIGWQIFCEAEMSHSTDVQGEIGPVGPTPTYIAQTLSQTLQQYTYSLGEKQ